MVYSLGFVDAVVGVVFDFVDNDVLANTDIIGGGGYGVWRWWCVVCRWSRGISRNIIGKIGADIGDLLRVGTKVCENLL